MPTNLSLYSAEGERGSWLLKILDTELEFFPILLSQLTISGDLHSFECALVFHELIREPYMIFHVIYDSVIRINCSLITSIVNQAPK